LHSIIGASVLARSSATMLAVIAGIGISIKYKSAPGHEEPGVEVRAAVLGTAAGSKAQ
jgi:hypothetical protein